MKIDFHIHTKYSPDSFTSLELLKKIFDKKDLVPVITDHNTIKGALKFKKMYGDCIIGEEIKAKEGEVIGLFLNEEIPRGLSIFETIERIKEQGGLVYLPHPFDKARKGVGKLNVKADIVEVFNARVIFQKFNREAQSYAFKNNLLMASASDAHFAKHVGYSYIELDNFYGKSGLLRSLRKAKLVRRKTPILALPLTTGVRWSRRLF
ncbi:MAG: histidinol-phosphatase [Nanoarchaeota archaeon]|nr:histidinol-phosphatase [Nanoarchaeota archaeon]